MTRDPATFHHEAFPPIQEQKAWKVLKGYKATPHVQPDWQELGVYLTWDEACKLLNEAETKVQEIGWRHHYTSRTTSYWVHPRKMQTKANMILTLKYDPMQEEG